MTYSILISLAPVVYVADCKGRWEVGEGAGGFAETSGRFVSTSLNMLAADVSGIPNLSASFRVCTGFLTQDAMWGGGAGCSLLDMSLPNLLW